MTRAVRAGKMNGYVDGGLGMDAQRGCDGRYSGIN